MPLAPAQEPTRDHDIVAEDYFSLSGISSIAVSPDGGSVAYTESRWDKEADGRTSELWIADIKSGQSSRLTFDDANQGSPHWSPDGRYIYFTSNQKRAGEEKPPYNGKKQVWRMSPDGGEMQAVTRVKDGVGSYRLSENGGSLYYTVSHEHVDEEWKDLRTEFKDLEYGHGVEKFTQIWHLDLKTWRSRKLVDNNRVIVSFEVAPDESMIAMHTTPDGTVTPDGWREGDPSPYGWLDSISIAGDSKALAFTISFDGFPTQIYVVEWKNGEHTLRELSRPDVVTVIGGTIHWKGSSRDLCFIGDDHARQRVYCIPGVRHGGQSKAKTVTPGDAVVGNYAFSADGKRLVVNHNALDNAGDLYAVDGGKLKRITRVNPQIDTWKLPQISIAQWTAPDGTPVEGILELPPDYKEGDGPLPLVVEIHGGPTAATHYRFRLWIYGRALLPSKGYALLSPNYRGSTGYGDKFMVDLIGHENDVEVKDILAGVDAMVEKGIADPDRLAVMGWSNGGYLTNCLITTTDRFKAASSGAGVLDQVIQWGTEDTPGHVINYMQSLPWDDTEAFLKGSPMYNLDKVSTPTLIHVGEHDARVPPAHARALYRALKHYLHVPTELIVYPGAGHGLTTYKHRHAKMKWDVAWFDKYLLPKVTEQPISEDKALDES
jgi:dipeptidyl aminopeptidase/acylaminoacyl peptidase